MNIELLSIEEMQKIYIKHMTDDFPDDELKPFERIREMYNEDYYFAYGLYDKGMLLGYAYFVKGEKSNSILLDYFAVISNKRNCGYGSKFLCLLKEELNIYNYFILESERILSAKNKEEQLIRTRRIKFYTKNGFIKSDLESCLFGVDYSLLYVGKSDDVDFYAAVSDIYNKMFYPKYMDKVRIIKGV